MTFLKNTWYVAAWAEEVNAEAMLARTILNEGVILFRDAAGKAVAMRDRCPHRAAPLHMGSVKDGVVQCGYHGLQFDGKGACVFNPHGDGNIPANAKVKSYPVAERHDAVWIWMGEAGRADEALIPALDMARSASATVVRGYLNAPSHYELMTDNLLDLGHTAYLHPDSLGSEAIVHSTRQTRRDGDKVVYELWAPDGDAPPIAQMLVPALCAGRVDHWMVSTWHAPCLIHQVTGFAPAGANREGAEVMNGFHVLTPETDTTTHYFHALSRGFRLDDPQLDAIIDGGVTMAFANQDFPMVGAIQRQLSGPDVGDARPVVLSTDAGGVMARRVLQQKLAQEAETAPVSAPAQVQSVQFVARRD
ncbi:MAG: aromatic ring-hydroxylating dioxygenase subunit alpha [Pseudomonadota bacterium]